MVTRCPRGFTSRTTVTVFRPVVEAELTEETQELGDCVHFSLYSARDHGQANVSAGGQDGLCIKEDTGEINLATSHAFVVLPRVTARSPRGFTSCTTVTIF